jgi:hypothetical protein
MAGSTIISSLQKKLYGNAKVVVTSATKEVYMCIYTDCSSGGRLKISMKSLQAR